MSAILTRSMEADVSTDGRTIEGRAFRWDTPSTVQDGPGQPVYREAFDRALAAGVGSTGLFVAHPLQPGARTSAEPIGRVEYEAADDGLAFRAEVFSTKLGDATLAMLESGGLGRDVSVGFWPVRDRKTGDLVVRESIRLIELSLLGADQKGAHAGAEIQVIRQELLTPNRDRIRRKSYLLLG